MESRNIVAGVLAITVALIVTASLLVPVLNDTTRTEDTFSNEGMYYIDYNDDSSHAIEYEKLTDGYSLTIDGEAVTLTTNAIGCTIVAGDNFILRYQTSNNTLQFKGNSQYITGITELSGSIASGTFTATCDGTAQGSTETSHSISATSDNIYSCTAAETDLIMSNYNVPVYVNADSEIFGFGQNAVGTQLVLFKVYGTIEDGITVEVRNGVTGAVDTSYTVTTPVISYDDVSGYEDLYKLNKITFTVSKDTDTANITFSAYIVPAETTAELSQHLNSAEIGLINVLPVLVIVSIVFMAVGMAAFRRD